MFSVLTTPLVYDAVFAAAWLQLHWDLSSAPPSATHQLSLSTLCGLAISISLSWPKKLYFPLVGGWPAFDALNAPLPEWVLQSVFVCCILCPGTWFVFARAHERAVRQVGGEATVLTLPSLTLSWQQCLIAQLSLSAILAVVAAVLSSLFLDGTLISTFTFPGVVADFQNFLQGSSLLVQLLLLRQEGKCEVIVGRFLAILAIKDCLEFGVDFYQWDYSRALTAPVLSWLMGDFFTALVLIDFLILYLSSSDWQSEVKTALGLAPAMGSPMGRAGDQALELV